MSFWEPSFGPNPQPFYAEGQPCENCGKPCIEDRIWIPGFNYFACSECAEESRILVYAEENCPTLYVAILRAKSIQQVRAAFVEHKETCAKCSVTKSGQRAEAGDHATHSANCEDLPRYQSPVEIPKRDDRRRHDREAA
jgi:hypothetical protein